MHAFIVANLCTVATLVGLLGGLVRGLIEARLEIRDALKFEPLAPMPLTWRQA